MSEVMKFLGDAMTPVAVSTVDGDRPRVRFFSFKMVENGNLYFITSKNKDVFKQLEKNNNIELCSMPSQEKSWVRIEGKVEFVYDVELNKKAFEILPMLKMAYKTPENDEIVLLKITDMNIKKSDLSGKVEELSF